MRAILSRLVIPVILIAAYVGATRASDEFSNEDSAEFSTEITTTAPETPVFSIRRAPELLTSPRAAEELNTALDAWAATLPPQSCFVVSAASQPLYEHQPKMSLTPASNMKLLTAVAALEALGPDYRFETVIGVTEVPDENGLLLGDLYVIGSGDPLLMTEAYLATLPGGNTRVHSSADTLADQTIATNIADINGAVVVIETRYDDERAPATIPVEDLDASLLGSLSAALLDRGFVGFKNQYDSQSADPQPPLPRSTDPAGDFAANFDDLLEARNVRISARARTETELPAETLIPLVTFRSPPLSEIVQAMLLTTDNTAAEMLVKELGSTATTTTTGSTVSGLLELSSQLNGLGLAGSEAFAFDGSGLSVDNKVTCSLVHDALNVPTHKDTIRAGLPVAGEPGALQGAFVGTPGEGRVRAESGTMAQAAALSGYFITDPGVELTFSLMINVSGEDVITPEQITGWLRPLPGLLAPFPAGPPLESLRPIGAPATSAGTGTDEAADPSENAEQVDDAESVEDPEPVDPDIEETPEAGDGG